MIVRYHSTYGMDLFVMGSNTLKANVYCESSIKAFQKEKYLALISVMLKSL